MSKLTRVRALPWGVAIQAGLVATRHWRALPRRDRSRLTHLLSSSRGWPGNLTARERRELATLVSKLDLKRAGRELVPLAGRARRGRRG